MFLVKLVQGSKELLTSADKGLESKDIAIPHGKIQLPKPFNERQRKLLLKCGVFIISLHSKSSTFI